MFPRIQVKYTTRFYVDGDAVIADLKKCIPDYEKNMDCYQECQAKTLDALKNASKLDMYHGDTSWPSIECNPRTDVWRMIEKLLANGR